MPILIYEAFDYQQAIPMTDFRNDWIFHRPHVVSIQPMYL